MNQPQNPNPFEPPAGRPAKHSPISSDPSIECEPHRVQREFLEDESQQRVDGVLSPGPPTEDESVEHSVWDEPGLSPSLIEDVPSDGLTYARWLDTRIEQTHGRTTWLVTLGVAAGSGLFAIVATLLRTWWLGNSFVMVCLVGPLTEEVMKIAITIWIIEKRPYLFGSNVQIIVCALASGATFAMVENQLYLNVYIPHPEAWLVAWRWTVCVALHVVCTLLAGLGLVRIWSHTMNTKTRPMLSRGSSWMITAIVVHSVYNTVVVLSSALNFQF